MKLNGKDFQVNAAYLLFEPDYYVFDFNPAEQTTKFLTLPEPHMRDAPFIDIRIEPIAQASFHIDTNHLLSIEGQHGVMRPTQHYIFHHAFVCSTLLARCLDQIDAFISLKEPWILRRLADIKRQTPDMPTNQWNEIFVKHTSLLSKNYRSGHASVIKATNVANNLLDDVLETRPQSKIVYLYSDLKSFLISNLKKTPETQQKMGWLLEGFLQDTNFKDRCPSIAAVEQHSFLQVCALIWACNLYALKCADNREDDNRILAVHMDDFLEKPSDVLESICKHFGHNPTGTDIKRMCNHTVMGTNAKQTSQRYNRDTKATEAKLILETYGSQIEGVLEWIFPIISELGLQKYIQKIH